MSTNHIVDQQAFRHGDGKGGMLHSVALIRHLDPNYQVSVFSCPFGDDGLPDYPKGGDTNQGKTFTTVRQASRFFDELVTQQRGRWTFLSPDETLPFTAESSAPTKKPIFEYVQEYRVAGVVCPWGRARQALASCFFDPVVQDFQRKFGDRARHRHSPWVMPLTTDFLPIVLHLALTGLGAMQRNGVILTEGQLRTIGRSVAAAPNIEALFRDLGLRELLPDYAAAIGGQSSALVL